MVDGQHPDHDTLAAFRQEHVEARAELLVQALRLCQKAGLVKLGNVSIGIPFEIPLQRIAADLNELHGDALSPRHPASGTLVYTWAVSRVVEAAATASATTYDQGPISV